MNADVVASELAIALGAEKLVFINDVPGLIGPTGDLLVGALGRSSAWTCSRATAWSRAGMIPKLESAVRALKAGVAASHLVDGRVEHAVVLELFTPEGVGTMITPDGVADGGRRAHRGERAVMPTYARYPVTLVRGDGARGLGRRGPRVPRLRRRRSERSPLGHAHPAWVRGGRGAARHARS